MKAEMKIHPLGNDALLIGLEQKIDPVTLEKVLMISHKIEQKRINGVIEVVPAYASLAVYYNPLVISYTTLKEKIEQLLAEQAFDNQKITRFLWEIPVCYELGIDMKKFASEKKLSPEEIIRHHTTPEYLVYMRGFVPGFLYLGGLDEQLYLQRKSTPTRKVPPGSVAIGGQQTGIYALPGPAGWHVIGQTPVKLFDPDHEDIMPIKPGDKVKFKAIAKNEFDRLITLSDRSIIEKKALI
jgi:inhibitor of KinA